MNAKAAAQRRRAVNGVLLLDKGAGYTSQSAVTRVKSLFDAAKAGHTGTLDPMATGLLPITFGEATKFSQALLDADKAYLATVRLGTTTTTGDLEGAVLTRSPVEVDRVQVEAALAQFRGEIAQTPPMYSALKHAGTPLYVYARAGAEVDRLPRRVTIHTLRAEHYESPDLRIVVACSKGTYIRVLAEDIGKALGCGATLAALRRTCVGSFSVNDALSLDALASVSGVERMRYMRAVDALLAGLPALELSSEQARRMVLGQSVVCSQRTAAGLLRVYSPDAGFLGVAEASADGCLKARRLLSSEPPRA